jgi:uncharacterized delta-60 repeat protein
MMPSRSTPTILIILCLGFLFLNLNGVIAEVQAQQVQVNTADPPSAEQGTINLNVKVTGKGFKNGAKAKWFVTGTTDTGGVTVNSTAFVSSTELSANITVSDTAVIANFDIQVLNSDGRGGKGTELFAVFAKGGGNATCPPMQPAPTSDTKCYDALPGCLDSTFGGSGFVYKDLTAFGGQTAMAVEVQPDGKIVVAAQVNSPSTGWDFAVLRYNVDGSLDTSFGDPDPFNPPLRLGYTVTALTVVSDWAKAMLLQPDGKIVVGGSANYSNDMAAARYNVDGTLDSSFGSGGIVRVSFGRNVGAEANDVGQQSDGKLLLLGRANNQVGLARLNANGSLDSSFGSGGKLTVNASGVKNGSGNGLGLAFQRVPAVTGEERMVVGGLSKTSSNDNSDWTLMRLRPDGSTDTSFGTGGIVKTAFSGLDDQLKKLKVDSSNRIVAVGIINLNSPCGNYVGDSALVRYTQDGGLDGSFSGGKQIVDVYGGIDSFKGLSFQADGKILIDGDSYSSGIDQRVLHLSLIRFNADGSRDASFGLLGNGVVTLDVTAYGGDLSAIVVQPTDGKIVVTGPVSLDSSGALIAVGRYLP